MKDIVCNEIDKLLQTKEKIIIAIEGRSAAGKSSLASLLKDKYDSNIFHMDDFFLPASKKTKERLEEAGGNVDYMRFKEAVMNNLKEDKEFKYQIFDCKVQALTEEISVASKKLNIIEGAYSMHPELIESYDLKIFLDIDDKSQKDRILKRNGNEIYKKFINEWIPLENKYFNDFEIRDKADILIN